MIHVKHIMSEQVTEMVGASLGTKLWMNGMMNELRRHPNEIPCKEGEIPSMILPFASGPEKVEWGFTAGMSCLVSNPDGSIAVQNADHFPSCTILALLSLLYDAGAAQGKQVKVSLSIPDDPSMKEFNSLLREVEQKLTHVTIRRISGRMITAPEPKPRMAFNFANSMCVVQSLNQIDIGRFVAKVRCVNGSVHVGDDLTITDGKFHVLQEHCPITQIVTASNQTVASSDEVDGDEFFVCFAMWFPADTPAFDGMALVKESQIPAFTPRTMPPAVSVKPAKESWMEKIKSLFK